MSSVVTDGNPVGASAQPKRHSPVFLAIFAVFLSATTLCALTAVLGIIFAGLASHDSASAIEMITAASLFYFKPNLLLGPAWLAWYLYATSGRPAEQDVLPAAVRSRDAASI